MELASGSGTFVKALSFIKKLQFHVVVEPTDQKQVMVERERERERERKRERLNE